MRILLVDDDDLFSDIVRRKLSSRGFSDVTRAESAEDALELIKSQPQPFDVYLLDIMLSGMDGVEFCRLLRQRNDCKSAPIIMITASQEMALLEGAFQAGATDFMRKPLDDAELAGRIRTSMLLVEATVRERRRKEVLLSGLELVPGFDTLRDVERICFSDVSGMMDYYRLENQLHTLEDGTYHLSVSRISMIGFQEYCTHTSRGASLKYLRAVSEQVTNTFPAGKLLLSYIGEGRLLCCIFGRPSRKQESLQNRLKSATGHAIKNIGPVAGGQIDFEVTQLADRRILTKHEAINLVRREIDEMSHFGTAASPKVDTVEDNIFHNF